MSVVSFLHENYNPFPAELTLGLFPLMKKKDSYLQIS